LIANYHHIQTDIVSNHRSIKVTLVLSCIAPKDLWLKALTCGGFSDYFSGSTPINKIKSTQISGEPIFFTPES